MKFEKLSITVLAIAFITLFVGWPVAIGISINQAVNEVLGSEFCKVAFGTLVAAFAGALGAQIISDKNKSREFYIKEIRNVNAAISLSFSICNAALALKKQHVKGLLENFYLQRNQIIDALEMQRSTGQRVKISQVFDLQFLQPLICPTEILQEHTFNKISAEGRILSLVNQLHVSKCDLNNMTCMRNDFIKEIKSNVISKKDVMPEYFGFPTPNETDNLHQSIIDGILSYLDDCIYFSEMLCKDLVEYGEYLNRSCREENIVVAKPDFSLPKENGLFPDSKFYVDWESAFIFKPYKPTL